MTDSTGTTAKPALRLTHTRADGTVLHGSSKGDGVWEIVRPWMRSSRNIGLYVKASRDRAAGWKVNAIAQALRDHGYEVTVDVDDVTPGRTFADAEQDRCDRADARHERFSERAVRNTAAGVERWRRSSDGLPEGGEPVKIGHHSEKWHRAAIERADTQCRIASEEIRKGRYWAERASAAAAYEAHRQDPGRTLRRIKKLEADRRRIERAIETGWQKDTHKDEKPPQNATMVAYLGGGYTRWRIEPSAEWHAVKQADLDQIDDELGYWAHVIEQAKESGVKVWEKADFERGDFVVTRYGVAVEVMRVNTRSVTIPWGHYWINAGPLITVEMCRRGAHGDRLHTDTVPYDDVHGRISKEAAAELLARNASVGEVKELIARGAGVAGSAAVDAGGS